MISKEGNIEFCPGCPNKGNFLGVINADPTVRFDWKNQTIAFVDGDGVNSTEIGAAALCEIAFERPDDSRVDKTLAKITNRIGRCSDGVSLEKSQCAAVNQEVITSLTTKV